MIILLSDKKGSFEGSFTEILSSFKIGVINDFKICEYDNPLVLISRHKIAEIKAEKGVVVLGESISHFKSQKLPKGIIGVCKENDFEGLELFRKNSVPIITIGMGGKNTLTLSSNEADSLMICLQRSIIDINGNFIEPCEIKVLKKKNIDPYSYLAATAVMLIYGIKGQENFVW